jgi:heavy metal sensor kinase
VKVQAQRFSRFFKGLRFRLALSYVLFFAVFLVGIGFVTQGILTSVIDREIRGVLEEEWGSVKGFMRIEDQKPSWSFENYDPEEKEIVDRIRKGAYMIATRDGTILEMSETYKALTPEKPAEIIAAIAKGQAMWLDRIDDYGYPYRLRAGVIFDKQRHPYYLVVGKPIAEYQNTIDNFSRYYSLSIPSGLVLIGLLGWLLSSRALLPLNQVAQAAQALTGSNLKVQIPLRGADDELDRLIESFNSMSERLHHSFEQIRQFSTDVSHELRTPLTAIRGQLEVALFTAKDTEQYKDAMVDALQDVEQLSNIVRALLLLSQAESGQLALQLAPIRLAEVIEDIVDQFQIPAEEEKIQLTANLRSPEATVWADRTQMGRLVTNLLSNAVKYSPGGGHVDVGLDVVDGWVVFSVKDTGVGIPKENLPHIFDRFYRVRPAHTQPTQGLGLGLSFVAWIVKAHEGTIDVESEPGKGTKLTVKLPLHTVPSETQRNRVLFVDQPESSGKIPHA